MSTEGTLSKVTIQAFENDTYTKKIGKPFKLPINPENYARTLRIKDEDAQAQGTGGNNPNHNQVEPEEIRLEFVFDNTGTVQGNLYQGTPVLEQIENFLEVVYKKKDKIHQPPFLQIGWGQFIFDCKLTDLSINYPLFNPNGEPLRAKLNATFKGFVEPVKRTLLEDKKSPDLTHVIKVKAGDELHYMTDEQYGSSEFFLQVAKVNQLTSPRLLKAGQNLVFPPIQK